MQGVIDVLLIRPRKRAHIQSVMLSDWLRTVLITCHVIARYYVCQSDSDVQAVQFFKEIWTREKH